MALGNRNVAVLLHPLSHLVSINDITNLFADFEFATVYLNGPYCILVKAVLSLM